MTVCVHASLARVNGSQRETASRAQDMEATTKRLAKDELLVTMFRALLEHTPGPPCFLMSAWRHHVDHGLLSTHASKGFNFFLKPLLA